MVSSFEVNFPRSFKLSEPNYNEQVCSLLGLGVDAVITVVCILCYCLVSSDEIFTTNFCKNPFNNLLDIYDLPDFLIKIN